MTWNLIVGSENRKEELGQRESMGKKKGAQRIKK